MKAVVQANGGHLPTLLVTDRLNKLYIIWLSTDYFIVDDCVCATFLKWLFLTCCIFGSVGLRKLWVIAFESRKTALVRAVKKKFVASIEQNLWAFRKTYFFGPLCTFANIHISERCPTHIATAADWWWWEWIGYWPGGFTDWLWWMTELVNGLPEEFITLAYSSMIPDVKYYLLRT